MKMKPRFLLMVILGLTLCLAGTPAHADDFFVIAGGGTAGKVLKTQVFTSTTPNNTLGTADWGKLDSPHWTYTKLSATSYLVITYQDSLYCTGGWGFYQLRVNDQASVAGLNGALLVAGANWNIYGATGVWPNLPKGEVTLSVWHRQSDCTACQQGMGWTTNVTVMEIEH
jgi:hypothetical protein